ncbi:hypothetical protein C7R54_22040 [Achromobacter aloeverae]|uniref:Surface antigen domain-containing protein n=1 Tax=Achromobacter aloeverae TaxID=1750518 RepID=A0A4Q1HG94_9BURK|nr:hypothetical protein C7R54_22040 [Achromobacter aloeverae]
MLTLLCLPAWGYAQGYGAFNNDTIYGTLKKDQRDSFDKAVAQVLNDARNDQVLDWNSATAGGKNPVSGKISTNGSRQQNGMPCRNLHAGLSRGSAHENWSFWFCQRSDGQWKAISQTRQ